MQIYTERTFTPPNPLSLYIIQIKICVNSGTCYPDQGWLSGTLAEANRPKPRSNYWVIISMSLYSAHILICFEAYILLYISLWVWLWTLQECHHAQCPLPLSIIIRMRLVISQSQLPACLAEVQLAHENTLWHLWHRAGEIEKKGWNLYHWGVFSTITKSMEIFFACLGVIYCISA